MPVMFDGACSNAPDSGAGLGVVVVGVVDVGLLGAGREEKVVALQERKRELFAAVVDEGEVFGSAITASDIRELLG
jgi:hypothetical protein